MSFHIIGGADEQTVIFLTSKNGLSLINIQGIVIALLILLPNIIYAVKFRDIENRCKSKVMNIIEQIGRYASLFFICFNVDFNEIGISSQEVFAIYYVSNTILLIAYWIIWVLYFKKKRLWKTMALALIPTAIFLLNGITLRHDLLVISAIVFGIGHIYVTYQNAK